MQFLKSHTKEDNTGHIIHTQNINNIVQKVFETSFFNYPLIIRLCIYFQLMVLTGDSCLYQVH